MTTSTIAESVQAHIRDQVLFGDDRDLSSSTPLLQLGILDSFALIALVAHLNDSFGIDIRADELNGRNFRDIDSIARLMAERLLSASALEPARRLGAGRQRTKEFSSSKVHLAHSYSASSPTLPVMMNDSAGGYRSESPAMGSLSNRRLFRLSHYRQRPEKGCGYQGLC